MEAIALVAVWSASRPSSSSRTSRSCSSLFPVLGWAAWRFQQPGAAPAALVVSLFATWAAVEQRGLFAGLTLSEEMFTLQAFNATVAFTSFFFAAVVSERLRARQALEDAAADLEERVELRTTELSTANERLAESQELSHLGSWDWDVATGVVNWSLEMYRIHGLPTRCPDHVRACRRVRGARRSSSYPGERGSCHRGAEGGDPRHRVSDRP